MITCTSQDAGYADVTIVNLLGAQVAKIFSGELTSGVHSFILYSNDLVPGMYECIVQMNGQAFRMPVMYYR